VALRARLRPNFNVKLLPQLLSDGMLDGQKGEHFMLQTIEAIIDQNGTLRVLEPVQWPKYRRVLITILNEEPSDELDNLALMSEVALAREWNRPEEDEAWSHLAQLPSL